MLFIRLCDRVPLTNQSASATASTLGAKFRVFFGSGKKMIEGKFPQFLGFPPKPILRVTAGTGTPVKIGNCFFPMSLVGPSLSPYPYTTRSYLMLFQPCGVTIWPNLRISGKIPQIKSLLQPQKNCRKPWGCVKT